MTFSQLLKKLKKVKKVYVGQKGSHIWGLNLRICPNRTVFPVSTISKLQHKFHAAYQSIFRLTCFIRLPAYLEMQQYCFYYSQLYLQFVIYVKLKRRKKRVHKHTGFITHALKMPSFPESKSKFYQSGHYWREQDSPMDSCHKI